MPAAGREAPAGEVEGGGAHSRLSRTGPDGWGGLARYGMQTTVSDNFAKLAESLYIADRQARDEISKRATIQKKLAEKEKEAKEEKLRLLAQRAREERYGGGGGGVGRVPARIARKGAHASGEGCADEEPGAPPTVCQVWRYGPRSRSGA